MDGELSSDELVVDGNSDTPDEPEVSADDAKRLLERVRGGDPTAAYDLLGRQATVKDWVAALDALRSIDASAVDLELVAHRSLRRLPEVVRALLRLVGGAGTSKAAFVAHAIRQLRDEPPLRAEAARIVERLVPSLDAIAVFATGTEGDALYQALTLAPEDARQTLELMREADAERLAAFLAAVSREDERLQELTREMRYRRDSYLFLVRRSLAELVVVAGVEGDLGGRAFRMLQLRGDDLEGLAEVLDAGSAGMRQRYVSWVLDQKPEKSPERAAFALRYARERGIPDLDDGNLERLVRAESRAVRLEATLLALAIGARRSLVEDAVTDLLGHVDASAAADLVRAALRRDPRLLRLDRLDANVRDSVIQVAAAADASLFEQSLVEAVPRFERSADVVAAVKAAVDAGAPIGFTGVVERTSERPDRVETLAGIVALAPVRLAAWNVLKRQPAELRVVLLRALVSASAPEEVELQCTDLLAPDDSGGEVDGDLLSDLVTLAVEGAVAPEVVERVAGTGASRALGIALDCARTDVAAADVLDEEVKAAKHHALTELRAELGPIVERGHQRAHGNQRLEELFARLASEIAEGDLPAPDLPPEMPALPSDVVASIERLGGAVRVESDASVVSFPSSSDTKRDAETLRLLATLDQRARGASRDPAERRSLEAAVAAIAEAFGPAGTAARAVSSLFERGPLFQMVVALSPDTRERLLGTAERADFELPAHWFDHPALGDWLRSRALSASGAGAVGAPTGSPPPTLAAAVRLARDSRTRRLAAEEHLDAVRHRTKLELVTEIKPVLDELASLFNAYVQLWEGLSRRGIRRVAVPGERLSHDEVDSTRHELISDRAASQLVVREGGLVVDSTVVERAKVEGVES